MPYTPLNSLPGICLVDSAYSNSIKTGETTAGMCIGRYTDMLNMRFIANRPEKIGGYTPVISTQLTGVCRGQKDWRDYSQNLYCAFGTNKKLMVYSQTSGTLIDITPFRFVVTGTLTNKLTTNGTTTVSVEHTAHGLSTGDYVKLSSSVALNGVTLGNTYFITRIDANNYTIIVPTAATGSTASGGGTTTYTYYRITIASPFDTVSGSNVVLVTHTAHGAGAGDYVTIAGGSAVGGLTLSGEYVIQSSTTNTYNIFAASNATSTANGGGSPTFTYNIRIGSVDASNLAGYGTGGYGQGGYGQGQVSSAIVQPRIWSLDNYGQQLYASPYADTIYVWDPSNYTANNGRAAPLYNAPATVLAMFITPERFVFALGTTSNYLLVQWPDQDDTTDWTALPTNTANSRTLQIGSYIVGGKAVRDGTSLVATNNCVYAFNYSGDQYIYDSTAAGANSGLIAPLAITSLAGNAYWMGPNEFWTWNGSVIALPSDDIRDFVYDNLNKAQAYKCFVATNAAQKEVTFYYPSNASNEIDSNVTFHIDQSCWSINDKIRTSQVDATLFQYPISTDASSNIWFEEYGVDANGAAMQAYIVYNPVAPAQANNIIDVMGFMPDFERQTGDVELTVLTQNYPEETAAEDGPYTLADDASNSILDLRLSARLLGYKLNSNSVGGNFRTGLCQADLNLAGSRR